MKEDGVEEEGLDLETQMFLIENTTIANMLVEEVIRDLDQGISPEMVHVKLLDHVYESHDEQGVTIHAFQNLSATAVLLLALERKRNDKR